MKNIELILFDLDGTLVDSREDVATSVKHGIEVVGGDPPTDQEIYCLIGIPLVEMFRRLLPLDKVGKCDQAAAAYRQRYIKHCADASTVYEGVFDCLDQLKSYPLAIATTKKTDQAVAVAQKLGFEHRFELIQGCDDIPAKPDPAVINAVLKKLDKSPKNCWMIGDTIYDIQAGKAAGVKTCAVTYGIGNIADLVKEQPTVMLDILSDFPKVL